MTTVDGIDVSQYQGDIDWGRVGEVKPGYVFIRTSFSHSADTEFAVNWQGADSAGLRRGPYHFFRYGTDVDQQISTFVDLITNHGGLSQQDLPPVVDVEYDKWGTQPDSDAHRAGYADALGKWLSGVEAQLKRLPIIYTGPSYWDDTLKNPSGFGTYPLWIANYGTSSPKVPGDWTQWTFWQYTESGTTLGVTGDVDQDRYNGDTASLEAFIKASYR